MQRGKSLLLSLSMLCLMLWYLGKWMKKCVIQWKCLEDGVLFVNLIIQFYVTILISTQFQPFFFSSKSLSSIFYQKLKQNAKISRIFPASSTKLPSSARTVIQKFDQPLFRSDKAQTRSANVYKSAVNAPKCNLPSVSVWNSHLDGR